MTFPEVLKHAMNLSTRDRALLADALRERVVFHERDLGLAPAQLRDLSHRIKEDAAGRPDPQDWEQFRLGMETQNW